MDLAQVFIDFLHTAADANAITESDFDEALSAAVETLSTRGQTETCSKIDPNGSQLEQITSALTITLGLFAQYNLNGSQAKSQLEEYSVSGARGVKIADAYIENKDKIRVSLDSLGSHLPHVTDCDWKLFHAVKSSQIDRPNALNCLVNLQTSDGEVQFSCEKIRLQSLVSVLREALRSLERQAEAK